MAVGSHVWQYILVTDGQVDHPDAVVLTQPGQLQSTHNSSAVAHQDVTKPHHGRLLRRGLRVVVGHMLSARQTTRSQYTGQQ